MRKHFFKARWLAVVVVVICLGQSNVSGAYDVDRDERDSGGSVMALLNPVDDIYGVKLMFQRWIIDTPVYGDYFMSFFSNNLEDASYAGFGLTVRLMPRVCVAPFVGVGGSYNTALTDNSGNLDGEIRIDSSGVSARMRTRSDYYWAGHVEGGLRFTSFRKGLFFESSFQYNWISVESGDYFLVGAGIGRSF